MDEKTIATLAVTLFIAFSGYLVKYLNDLRLAQRKDRLERVNQQLRDLYGPLFSLNHVGLQTWDAFAEQYCENPSFMTENGICPQTEEAAHIWRHWMKNVFMPLNLKIVELVMNHADLLEEEEMPECLLLLSIHVQGYKGIMAAWENGDYTRHMSLRPFPAGELYTYAEKAYRKLKSRQAQLLRRNH